MTWLDRHRNIIEPMLGPLGFIGHVLIVVGVLRLLGVL